MRFVRQHFGRWLLPVVLTTTTACLEVSEDSAPTAKCVSGRKWVAGDIGHAEMHPGRNCVGCHLESDGPPLALGGTVYTSNNQEADCYGVENVTVVITEVTDDPATAKQLELVTNAAGNFFLEGDPSSFNKPFSVTLKAWDELGMYKEFPMATRPETGDCAHCHGAAPLAAGETPSVRKFPYLNISLQHPIPADLQPAP